MCDLTDLNSPHFPMTNGELRMARILHKHTRLDVRDIKTFGGYVQAWILGRGWTRINTLLHETT